MHQAVSTHLTTAPDILRLLVARSGGDPSLLGPQHLRPLPRSLRRMMLAALDDMPPHAVIEDMRRHRRTWRLVARLVHPFEHARRYPKAAVSFAALLGTRLDDGELSHILRMAAADIPTITVSGQRLAVRTWRGALEASLAEADLATSLSLLARRPSELVRRLDHLLRLSPPAQEGLLLQCLADAAPQVAPAVLLSCLGALRSRSEQREYRVVFPKGRTAKAHLLRDSRPALAARSASRAASVIESELLLRAAQQSCVNTAVIDTAIDGLTAPTTERTASQSLVALPRGSNLIIPPGRIVRLFLHWMEKVKSDSADLDLSAAFFGESWDFLGMCDFTDLRRGDTAAVHSGDLTSAPPPQGASEFIDLDLDALDRACIRHVVPVVLSFDNIPFDQLEEACAGVMVRNHPVIGDEAFDPRTVEQRFDLTGKARACVPFVIDTRQRTMRWLDVVKSLTGTHHTVAAHQDSLGLLGRELSAFYDSGARVGLGELARWQAAARAHTVLVRRPSGICNEFVRRSEESTALFAARIGTEDHDGVSSDGGEILDSAAGLAYLLKEDFRVADGGEVFALYPDASASARRLTASDMVTSFALRQV